MIDRRALRAAGGLRLLGVALLLAEGAVHLQQVEGPLKAVPTINTLFVLNAVGAAIVALVLAGSRERVAVLGALAGLSLTLTAVVSLAISRTSTLFAYSEPTLRTGHARSADRTRRDPRSGRLRARAAAPARRLVDVPRLVPNKKRER
jgi:hypothetical protein